MKRQLRTRIGNVVLAPFIYWVLLRKRGLKLYEIFGLAAFFIIIGMVIGAVYF